MNLYICVAVVVVPLLDAGLNSEQLKIQQGFGGLLPSCLPDAASSTQLLIIACFQERKLQTEFLTFDFPLWLSLTLYILLKWEGVSYTVWW